jgi:hypothetical protein
MSWSLNVLIEFRKKKGGWGWRVWDKLLILWGWMKRLK